MADGRELDVPHRDFIMVVPSGGTLVVASPDGTVDIIDLLLISALELRANGSGRRKRKGNHS
jgi:hypothetical protein